MIGQKELLRLLLNYLITKRQMKTRLLVLWECSLICEILSCAKAIACLFYIPSLVSSLTKLKDKQKQFEVAKLIVSSGAGIIVMTQHFSWRIVA